MNKSQKFKILTSSELVKRYPINNLIKNLEINSSSIFAENLLTEYDCIILNTSSGHTVNQNRLSQLINYIKSNKGLVICLIDKMIGSWNSFNNFHYIEGVLNDIIKIQAYELFNNLNVGYEYKLTLEMQNTSFFDYLNKERNYWSIAVKNENLDKIIPLALNFDNEAISFTTIQYPYRIYFLPYIENKASEFWTSIYNELRNIRLFLNEVPEWTKNYILPTLTEKNNNIDELQININKLESEKETIINEKKYLEHIKNVLFCGSGLLLQNTVKEALISLGIDAKDGKSNREDITFIFENKHFVIEVKGLSKSVGEKDVSQLVSKKVQYEEEHLVEAKGILIANAWKDMPIEERNTIETIIFPDQMKKLTELRKVALLTTQQLFVAYCKNLEVNFDVNKFISNIENTVWIFKDLNEIDNYKLNT